MEHPKDRKEISTEKWDDSLFENAFLMEHKADYIKQPKHYEDQNEQICIICKIIRKDEDIERFEIYRNETIIIFMNVYPYTTGHLLISPLSHKIAYDELSYEEIKELGILMQRSLKMLKHFGKTDSFNCGWNQGLWSGGSIAHFHIHIVPRYKNDMNFIDIIARSRPVLHSLESVEEELIKYQPFLAGKKKLNEIFDY